MAALDKEEATRNAMRACMPGIPGRKTDIRCGIVFVVSADGRISLYARPITGLHYVLARLQGTSTCSTAAA